MLWLLIRVGSGFFLTEPDPVKKFRILTSGQDPYFSFKSNPDLKPFQHPVADGNLRILQLNLR